MAQMDFDIPGPIGIQDIEVEQGFTMLKTNRTLLVANLQKEGPFDPEILPQENTGSLSKIFEYANPQITVNLETGKEDNPEQEETIRFKELKDFRPEELTKSVAILQRLASKEKRFQKLVDEIERNKKLQALITDPDKREAFLDIMRSIQEELAGKS